MRHFMSRASSFCLFLFFIFCNQIVTHFSENCNPYFFRSSVECPDLLRRNAFPRLPSPLSDCFFVCLHVKILRSRNDKKQAAAYGGLLFVRIRGLPPGSCGPCVLLLHLPVQLSHFREDKEGYDHAGGKIRNGTCIEDAVQSPEKGQDQ